ncbi:hypothetical protein ACGF0J_13960 [Nonomuraea sp. NPDC047897]|uniref:hypothetical protein n=1 Tax=Nonomuraea sp. NPDC047897 TaxID=3364346 RepID=UPI0037220404
MPLVETFEGNPLSLEWSGDWGWTGSRAHGGTWSFWSADIGDNGTSTVTFTLPPRATTIQFWYSVSSEATYDKFEFLINGVVQLTASGEVGWTQSAVFDVSGATQVVFRYTKDGDTSTGEDAAWIDDLTIDFPSLSAPYANNFNGGTAGTAITKANSGGASGNAFNNLVGSPQFTNLVTRGESGLAAVNAVQGSDTHVDWAGVPMVGEQFCSRLYVNFEAMTSGGLFAVIGETGIVSKSWVYGAGAVIDVYTGAAASRILTTNQVLPVGQWVRIEYRYTVNAANNGTVEVWTYLDPDSDVHDDYAVSANLVFPGGKPLKAEFHLRNVAAGRWFLDEVAIGPSKLGPAPSTASRRPRAVVGASRAAHRAASW